MEKYELSLAIKQLKEQLANCGIDPNDFLKDQIISWAIEILMLEEYKYINRNLQIIEESLTEKR